MVKKKIDEIQTSFGTVKIITTEHPQFKHRKEVICWLGELQCVELGELDKCLRVADRKSDFEPIRYVPFFYTARWNENADISGVQPYYSPEEIEEGEIEFDDEDEAREFIAKLRCKTVKQGGVFTDTRKRFNAIKKAVEEVRREELSES